MTEFPGPGPMQHLRQVLAITFLASILGFTGLFVWMYRLRAEMLMLHERLAQREGSYAELPA